MQMKTLRKTLRTMLAVGAMAMVPLSASFASETDSALGTEARIPFANHGGIRDWQADHDKGLWVQDVHRNWYYAKFMGTCFGLNFANSIGFDTHPLGQFDKFSSITVPREGRCVVTSFTRSGAPPTKAQLKSQASSASPKFDG
jgi:uncharacterized protein DUF6491